MSGSEVLDSPRNPRVVAIASLHDAKVRRRERLHLAEGVRVCREALRSGDVVELLHVGTLEDLAADVGPQVRVTQVGPRAMARISDAATPPGVVAVVRTMETGTPPAAHGPLLVLDGVADPGNVGTLIRTAAAFGAGVVSIGGADPFGPKAVRASAGTCYATSIHRPEPDVELAPILRGAGRTILGLAADGEVTLRDAAREVPAAGVALVLGSEPHGLGPTVRTAVDRLVSIPMMPTVESLNVGAAGAIAMHALMQA